MTKPETEAIMKPETSDMSRYLQVTDIIDFNHELISAAAKKLKGGTQMKIGAKDTGSYEQAYVKSAFEYVRDTFPHSFDLLESGRPIFQVSCKASDVLFNEHGMCYAKSHLLAALLRDAGIPTGFCYQKLLLSDENPKIILHAVNAVYLSSLRKWIRLDSRGNKPGIDAQFSVDEERLAFPVRPELGEEDGFVIYAEPSRNVIEVLTKIKKLTDLIDNLPDKV